jgi:hypothetical protein
MSIKRRLHALEAAAELAADPLVVIIRSFAEGPLVAYRIGDQVIERREGETDQALAGRAIAEVRAPGTVFALREVRRPGSDAATC